MHPPSATGTAATVTASSVTRRLKFMSFPPIFAYLRHILSAALPGARIFDEFDDAIIALSFRPYAIRSEHVRSRTPI
ncbi:hypothetical protein Sar04_49030 [Salinispora arenicola]|uniref:Uncharacterized protein n=1 Tax=Salinispora arenicola TaxID=168697 RepID=A0ABQ4JZ39_SALAC|nr:hypothetical protein Sar04_49030 [Salinispora arenicola]